MSSISIEASEGDLSSLKSEILISSGVLTGLFFGSLA